MITKTFTIEAIDKTSRVVTLKDPAGMLESVYCGPEVQRFDALKVGDMVTFRYHESLVTALRRPGQAPRATESAGVTRTPGANPGGDHRAADHLDGHAPGDRPQDALGDREDRPGLR